MFPQILSKKESATLCAIKDQIPKVISLPQIPYCKPPLFLIFVGENRGHRNYLLFSTLWSPVVYMNIQKHISIPYFLYVQTNSCLGSLYDNTHVFLISLISFYLLSLFFVIHHRLKIGVTVVAQWLMYLTSSHENVGLIPGLTLQVKDLALLWAVV